MQGYGGSGFLGRCPELVVDGVPVRRVSLGGLAVDHGTFQTPVQGSGQLIDSPINVIHGDHADADEPLRAIGYELRHPIVIDLRASLQYRPVRVAHQSQHGGGVHHLGVDTGFQLELDPHLRVISNGAHSHFLGLVGGSLGLTG